jgi:hypothetical protein
MPGRNALAYSPRVSVTKKKSSITWAPKAHGLKLFSFSYSWQISYSVFHWQAYLALYLQVRPGVYPRGKDLKGAILGQGLDLLANIRLG